MKKTRRDFDVLTEKERLTAIEYIITHFRKERNENMDIISAGEVLDVVLQEVMPKIYNKTIEDIRAALKNHMENFDVELNILKK